MDVGTWIISDAGIDTGRGLERAGEGKLGVLRSSRGAAATLFTCCSCRLLPFFHPQRLSLIVVALSTLICGLAGYPAASKRLSFLPRYVMGCLRKDEAN